MENAPLNPAAGDSDEKPGGKKKKKNAEALGVFALDSKPANNPVERPENIWEKLTLSKRKGGETVKETPLSQVFTAAEAHSPGVGEADEAEVAPETLSEPEERFVERTIVEARRQAESAPPVHEEAVNPEAAGHEGAAAEAVELFRHKIISGGEPAEQAFTETLQSLGVETSGSERPPEPPVAGRADVAPETLAEPEKASRRSEMPRVEQADEPIPESIHINPTKEATEETGAPDRDEPSSSVPGMGGPPRPPRTPRLAETDYFLPAPAAPPARPAKTEKEFVPYYNNEDVVGAAFLGGLVGYLIGRRRGRIRTERKLKPIQKKLEQRVVAAERDIAVKEAHIRKMARQQAREQQRFQRTERTLRRDQHRLEAPEANQLHGKQVAPEQIGHVIVAAGDTPETSRRRFAETRAEAATSTKTGDTSKTERSREVEAPKPKPVDKRIETMSRAELLDLSGHVPVENTTLRQIYETHLVGEQGLRRLVSEYTRGGDVQKALRVELVEHEIDFERDPMLRDRKRPAEPSANHGQPTLETLLQKAGVLDHAEVREELATLKVRQAHQEQRHQEQQKRRHVLDVSMVTVIAVLTALVIMLLLRGR